MQANKFAPAFFIAICSGVRKVWIFGKPETIWLQKFDSFLSSKFAEVLKDKLLLIVLLFDYIGTNEKFEYLRHTLKT